MRNCNIQQKSVAKFKTHFYIILYYIILYQIILYQIILKHTVSQKNVNLTYFKYFYRSYKKLWHGLGWKATHSCSQ